MTDWKTKELDGLRAYEAALARDIKQASIAVKTWPNNGVICRRWIELAEFRANILKRISSLALVEIE